jgi:hypothetical protein
MHSLEYVCAQPVRPLARTTGDDDGWYWSCVAASLTCALVFEETPTVAGEKPDRAAT